MANNNPVQPVCSDSSRVAPSFTTSEISPNVLRQTENIEDFESAILDKHGDIIKDRRDITSNDIFNARRDHWSRPDPDKDNISMTSAKIYEEFSDSDDESFEDAIEELPLRGAAPLAKAESGLLWGAALSQDEDEAVGSSGVQDLTPDCAPKPFQGMDSGAECADSQASGPSYGEEQGATAALPSDCPMSNEAGSEQGQADSVDDEEAEAAELEIRRQREAEMTEEEREALKDDAQQLKTKGNMLFRDKQYVDAVETYTQGLHLCPLCCAKERAIMYSNRSACRLKMEQNEKAIADCSKALELNPHYLKALMRRAELYEKSEKLDEALADYQKILEMDPSQHTARNACLKLPDQIKERNEKMKEEMLGKLKELGNMVLRPFGLSTNNFKLQQDPNTGGYSVQFQQKEEPPQ